MLDLLGGVTEVIKLLCGTLKIKFIWVRQNQEKTAKQQATNSFLLNFLPVKQRIIP